LQLTRFSDIGIRLLMYLAAQQRATPPVTVAEVATQFKVPRNHLVKVAGLLAKHGYITTLRGRMGGISLAREPANIQIGAVLRVLEGKNEVIACEALECGLNRGCGFRSVLKDALEDFYHKLDQYSLADITSGEPKAEIIRMQASFVRIKAAIH
jgi:Rrf2 family transcriptional regulator, nitric oxide-sensitive transcriptional repressor